MKKRFEWKTWAAGSLAAGTALALLDPIGISFTSWLAFTAVSVIGLGLLLAAWWWLAPEDAGLSRKVALVLASAVLLRLAAAATLVHVLPAFGYDEPVQQSGYVFYDAFARDTDAWKIASSGDPLISSLKRFEDTDQYGGLLLVSSAVYRYLSPGAHHPLLISVLSAFVGSLAVLFTWKSGQKYLGGKLGLFAAWVVALYPDAVLLSASQMREPYLISGFAAALLAYMFIRDGRIMEALAGFAISLALLSISPPFALLALGIIALAWIWEGRRHSKQTGWILIGIGIAALAALVITLLAWSGSGIVMGSGLSALREWLQRSAEYQVYLMERNSGWVQKMFERTPEWTHLPMVTLYGLIQPFFPAGLMSEGAWVWRILVAWRGLGWMVMTAFLAYAPLAALRGQGVRGLVTYLAIAVWLVALLASFRSAGDLWDNPRYRTVLLSAQALAAAWAVMHSRKINSLWLVRTGVIAAFVNIMFLIWYAGRGQLIPRLYFDQILKIIAGFTVVFIPGCAVWDWMRSTRRRLTK